MRPDEFEDKTIPEMDVLIKRAGKEFNLQTRKFNALSKKYLPRPSQMQRKELGELKREQQIAENTLKLYEAIKEAKVPLWEKFKEECPESTYCKHSVLSLINKSLAETVKETTEQEKRIQKTITKQGE